MTHRFVSSSIIGLAVTAAAACGSSSPRSQEPTEPARSISTATAEPVTTSPAAADPAPSGEPAAFDPRIVEGIELMERFIVALEAAGGDCDRLVDAIEEFAHSEDGKAMRRFTHDEELQALAQTHKAAVKAAHPTLEPRFRASLSACSDADKIRDALDDSKLFVKRRDDGAIVEE